MITGDKDDDDWRPGEYLVIRALNRCRHIPGILRHSPLCCQQINSATDQHDDDHDGDDGDDGDDDHDGDDGQRLWRWWW